MAADERIHRLNRELCRHSLGPVTTNSNQIVASRRGSSPGSGAQERSKDGTAPRRARSRASLDGSYHRGTPQMRKIQLALLRKVQSALRGAAAFVRPDHENAGKLRNPGGLANVR